APSGAWRAPQPARTAVGLGSSALTRHGWRPPCSDHVGQQGDARHRLLYRLTPPDLSLPDGHMGSLPPWPCRAAPCRYYSRLQIRLNLSRAAVVLVLVSPPAAAQAPQSPPAIPGSPPATPSVPEEPVQLPAVQVIGTTPLPSLGVPLDKYPGNAQRLTAAEIRRGNPVDLPDQHFPKF